MGSITSSPDPYRVRMQKLGEDMDARERLRFRLPTCFQCGRTATHIGLNEGGTEFYFCSHCINPKDQSTWPKNMVDAKKIVTDRRGLLS